MERGGGGGEGSRRWQQMRVDEGERPSLSAESHLNPFLINSLWHMIYLHPLTHTHTQRSSSSYHKKQPPASLLLHGFVLPQPTPLRMRVDKPVLGFINASFRTGTTVTFYYANGTQPRDEDAGVTKCNWPTWKRWHFLGLWWKVHPVPLQCKCFLRNISKLKKNFLLQFVFFIVLVVISIDYYTKGYSPKIIIWRTKSQLKIKN